jgi:hypothetical protein
MKKQMEMFEDGGLKDEGGMIDEVSGNDVPSGSTREEVRDDIPAQLSEGEFVFPADVVRFIGLEKLMQLRQEAKQGLKQMEAMGQMGNSDEATMRDDMPFDINDLDMEDEVEYNRGGVVEAANGTYVAPTVPTGIQPLGTNPMGNPVGVTQEVADGVSGSTQGTPYTPNVGNMYTPTAQAYAPVSYNEFLGPSAGGAPTTENVRYFNEATGQTRMIPHLVNADGSRGATLYPVPEGFVIQEEAPKEEAKKTTTPTAKVQPVEDTGNDSQDIEEREREEAMYGLGAGRVSLGGSRATETKYVGEGVKSRQFEGSIIGSTTFGIQYADVVKDPALLGLAKGVGRLVGMMYSPLGAISTIGQGLYKSYQYSKGKMPDDKVAIYTINGIPQVIPAKVHNAITKNPRGPEALALIANSKKQKERFDVIKKVNPKLSRKEIIEMVTNMESADVDGSLTADNMKAIQAGLQAGKDGKPMELAQTDISEKAMQDRADKQAAEQRAAEQKVADARAAQRAAVKAEPRPTTANTYSDDSQPSSGSSGDFGFGTSTNTTDYGGTYKGSLITRNKPSKKKPKKMKRGGLASR